MPQKHLITARFGAAHNSLTIHLESGDQVVDLSKIRQKIPTVMKRDGEDDGAFRKRASETYSHAKKSYAKERRSAISMVTEFWAKSHGVEFRDISQLND